VTEVYTRGDMNRDREKATFAKNQHALVEKQIGEIGQGALIGGYEALKGEKSDFCFKVSLNNCKYVRVSREELLNVMRTSRYFSTVVAQECLKFYQKLKQIKAVAFCRWVDIRKVEQSTDSIADLDPAVYANISRMSTIRVGNRALKVEDIIRQKQEIMQKKKEAKEAYLRNTSSNADSLKRPASTNQPRSHQIRHTRDATDANKQMGSLERTNKESLVEAKAKTHGMAKQGTLSKAEGSTAFNTTEELSTNFKSEHWRLDGYLKKTVRLLQQAQQQDVLFENTSEACTSEAKMSARDAKDRLVSAMSSEPKLLRLVNYGSQAALRTGLAFTSSGTRDLHAGRRNTFKVKNMRLQFSDCYLNKTDESTRTVNAKQEATQLRISTTVHFPAEELKKMISDYRFMTEATEQRRPQTSRFRDNGRAELALEHRTFSAARIPVNPRPK